MNEVRSDPREQKIERARFFVCRVVRARYAFCAPRVCAVWRELRSPARGVRTSGALVPYLSCFLVSLAASGRRRDGVGGVGRATEWSRDGVGSSLCVPNSCGRQSDLIKGRGRSHSPTRKNNPHKKKRFLIRARMRSIRVGVVSGVNSARHDSAWVGRAGHGRKKERRGGRRGK